MGEICLGQEIKLKVDCLFFREVLLSVLYRNVNYWEPHCQIADFFSEKFVNSVITDLLTFCQRTVTHDQKLHKDFISIILDAPYNITRRVYFSGYVGFL